MRYIIDRIEGEFAVCECENELIVNIPVTDISGEVTEGACVIFDEYGYHVSAEKPKETNKKLFDSLFKKDI